MLYGQGELRPAVGFIYAIKDSLTLPCYDIINLERSGADYVTQDLGSPGSL
jgi:hypothetical protein